MKKLSFLGICVLSLWGASCQRSASPVRTTPQTRSEVRPLVRAMPNRSTAASSQSSQAPPRLQSVLISGVPHVKQKPDFCGEACAEMALKKLGYAIDQDQIFARCKVDPALGRGCVTRELAKALKATGFAVGKVWHAIQVSKAKAQLQEQFAALHGDLKKGIPSIVCMRYDAHPKTTEHFRLILGYDRASDEVLYHEPAKAGASYLRMKRSRFLSLWPLKYQTRHWLAIRLRLKPEKIRAATRPSSSFSPADYAQHVIKLRKKLPAGFTVVLQPPFVVVGDESPSVVRRRAQNTVQWAVRHLKKLYFKKDPPKIIDVWLFKDRSSYRKHTLSLFNERPTTPFGYYSEKHWALIMNISTGGGTLVHEIVHPFVAANFPGYRAWFNEGLGSLYEQCGEVKGAIVGFTNWRLAGLQRAIRANKLPSFKTLTHTTEWQFYQADPGTNYAQSRYLLYYLQQKGKLVGYYHAYFKARNSDPTGYKTLKKILGVKDVKAFQKRWEKWVLKLRFR